MPFSHLPFHATLAEYQSQADRLLEGWKAADRDAMKIVRERHPGFLRADVTWAPRRMSEDEMRSVPLDEDDARLAVARWYEFRDWPALQEYVSAVGQDGSPVVRFETAVEAVIGGDRETLERLLRDDPGLVRARSTRINSFDPPAHRSTLLHYLAANGVEGHRQRSPENAVEIATILLRAGADPDALSLAYGGECTTMTLLVSSTPPARAGVQVPLVHTMVDYGAAVEPRGTGSWTSPLMTALAFSYVGAAAALVSRGARVDTVAAAAGLGRLDDVKRMLSDSTEIDRHRALALAAQLGHLEIVRVLLDAGEDPNRYNPKSNHAHSTPMHQAALAGHVDVVRLLVERGARLDIKDTIWDGTPLGWANYCKQPAVAEYLRSVGAPA